MVMVLNAKIISLRFCRTDMDNVINFILFLFFYY